MFVQREDDKIIGVFSEKQKYAQEWLDDDSSELNDYFNSLGKYSLPYNHQRAISYNPIGDQLDAIWKQFEKMENDGLQLHPETKNELNAILKVKSDFPKK